MHAFLTISQAYMVGSQTSPMMHLVYTLLPCFVCIVGDALGRTAADEYTLAVRSLGALTW